MCRRGHANDAARFLLMHGELGCDPILDLALDEEQLNRRIEQKVQFIRAYLVDISYDGGDFMSRHSKFLHLQYAGRSARALGVWLEQSMDVPEIEAGSSFHFQGFDGWLFLNNMKDVDWASIRSVLPFDLMHVEKPDGSKWTQADRKQLKELLSEDLGSDGHDYKVRMTEKAGSLTLEFNWLQ